MDYAKLIYAAEVRKLAVEYRNAARTAFEAGIESMPGTDNNIQEIADLMRAWDGKYPVSYFFTKAVRQINEAAKVLAATEQKSED